MSSSESATPERHTVLSAASLLLSQNRVGQSQ